MGTYKLEDTGQSDSVFPVDSVIPVEVVDVTERVIQRKDGGDFTKINFRFKVLGMSSELEKECGELEGSTIWGSVPARFTNHPDNQLRQWTEALFGLTLEPGFELNTEMLRTRKARAIIGHYVRNNGATNHQVVGLLPYAANPVSLNQSAQALVQEAPVQDTLPQTPVQNGQRSPLTQGLSVASQALMRQKAAANARYGQGIEDDDPPPF